MTSAVRSGAIGAALVILLGCSLIASCGCSGNPPAAHDREPAEGRRVITGTVIDAATNTVVKAAEISAPGSGKVKSDAAGRFSLELANETSGALTASASDGRTGSVLLRPLREGAARRLEVVLYVAP